MPLTQNECTVTDLFHFAKEISEQDPNLYITSLDVHSLVTNIPRDETIDICIDSLYIDEENTDLKQLKDEEIIDKTTFKNIKPCRSRSGVAYKLGKVHKETKNGLPPFRPILSAIGMPTYKLAKILLHFLKLLTQNKYIVRDSFHFAEEISKQDPNLYMASLDVDSLVTNISLDETVDICIDTLYKDDENTL